MPVQAPDVASQANIADSTIAGALFQNGTAQVGGMVTSITLVGQAFANLDIHSAAAPLAAFVFATLLAVYQVSMIQKAPRRSCFILVPIATLILFALSYAGNNSLAPPPDTETLEQELALTKTQLQIQKQQQAASDALLAQFQKALGLKADAGATSHNLQTPASSPVGALIDALLPVAIAQPASTVAPGDTQRRQQELSKALQEYQVQQQKLQQEQQQLEQQRRDIQHQKPPSSSWRPWGR